jgi:homoserine dehydrogenase
LLGEQATSKPSSWAQWGNKIAAASRPAHIAGTKIGVDIVGYGPIGRLLSIKLASMTPRFSIASITDSSAVLYPKDNAQVLEVAKWKAENKENRLSEFHDAKLGQKGDLLQGIQFSHSSIVVDATNSDYAKNVEAKGRADLALNSGKHYVTANKVSLAFHYGEIFDLAKRKGLLVKYGATNISGRHAIIIAQSMAKDELIQVQGLLNSATTVILSSLEEDPSLSMDQAIEISRKEGILESDPSIDLDGWDAAAKTAILSNAIFPDRKITINEVSRIGIRDEKATTLIDTAKKDLGKKYKVREVSEITKDKASVEPRLVETTSSLAVGGHIGVVSLFSQVSGEITIKSTFQAGGVELTSSVLLSDINQIAAMMG